MNGAYRAFEHPFDVLDYIVKEPSEFLHEEPGVRMQERLGRIFSRIRQMEKEKGHGILIECGSRKVRVKKEDIISIEAIKGRHQLEIITEKEMLTSQMSLKAVEEMLDDSFIYVSRSCLISGKKHPGNGPEKPVCSYDKRKENRDFLQKAEGSVGGGL